MNRKIGATAVITFLLTGCAAGWISDPSPQVRDFVSDLRLEGFDCNAKFSNIECVQMNPMRESQPSQCDSKRGCIAQPDHLIYNVYKVGQTATGVPEVEHSLMRKEDSFLAPDVGG